MSKQHSSDPPPTHQDHPSHTPYCEWVASAINLRQSLLVDSAILRMTGCGDEAVILCMLIASSIEDGRKRAHDWFFCSTEELQGQTGFSRPKLGRLVAKLKKRGFIATKMVGYPSIRSVCVRHGMIAAAIEAWEKEQSQ